MSAGAGNDCCTPGGSGPKSYGEALALLLAHAEPLSETERVSLDQALGRVCAAPVTSRIDVPGWDNSSMDGYALRIADLSGPGDGLPVSQRIPAGTAPRPLATGTVARIFTGAPIPEGADAVVMQERCRPEGGAVVIQAPVAAGQNIRHKGEDIAAGAEIISRGTRLRPQHLGLAASVGVDRLTVTRSIRVAFFSSGDELVMPGQPLSPGKIYNSNRFTGRGLLEALGCEVLDLGIVEDTLEATEEALARGAREADLVLASGGVSVGEKDHVKPAVERLGSLKLWHIAIRPGKPVAFGHIDGTPFLGAPGNPVSLFTTFVLFARPFILKRQGCSDYLAEPLRVVTDFEWTRPDSRREYHRARLVQGSDGQARVQVYPSRSSAVLSSVTWANGLVVIPEGRTLSPGDSVDFLPFSELLC
jgi:molybdopterin molybdotransferase